MYVSKKSLSRLNCYSIHNFIRNIITMTPVFMSAYEALVIKNVILLIGVAIVQLAIGIYLYNLYIVAKPINKSNLTNKYVYHCLNKAKLNRIQIGDKVHLKKTTNKWHNISTNFKNVVYFHSSLKGNSFLFNHGYKYNDMDYILIIPVKKLSESLSIRRIDGAIVDTNEYIGNAKCVPIEKFNIYKKLKKQYIKKVLFDYFETFLLINAISLIVFSFCFRII